MGSNEVTSVNGLSLPVWVTVPPCHNPVVGCGWSMLESAQCVFAKTSICKHLLSCTWLQEDMGWRK